MIESLRGNIRQAMWLANANALVWAIGNGLVSTLLVTYLALELGAKGIAISLILAAPRLAGVLRLAAPALMATGYQRKLLCLIGYFTSALVLLAMPPLAVMQGKSVQGITILVVLWCVYHLLEYVATVALWSWLGDWMPPLLRGRLIGWREGFLVVGRIVGIGASVLLATFWSVVDPDSASWVPLYWSAIIGAKLMILAVVPLCWLGARTTQHPLPPLNLWKSLTRAIEDPKYGRLLGYSCWFAFANGISGAAQSIYPWRVLGIEYNWMVGMRSMMYAGQTVIAPVSGYQIDRFGARKLMTVCQLIVATGPLFYVISTPSQPWWIVGAFFVWIFYAPLNVGLDTLKLKLAPDAQTGPSLAVYYAMSDLAYAGSAILAGAFYDKLRDGGADVAWLFAVFFVGGWLLRSSAAVLVWQIRE